MPEKKIIAVAGATGAQGGGLVRAILNDKNGQYSARAITRDPSSAKAKRLGELGAELVQADLHYPETVRKAYEGAYGAYCVTFFWNHLSPELEFKEASSMANAARDAGLKHVVWSTLEDTRQWVPLNDTRMPTLMGKYKVPHFDSKAEAEWVIRDSGIPTTYLLASFYWENFIGSGPKRDPSGEIVLSLPMANAKLAGIAAEDIGKSAFSILRRGPEMADKRIGVAGEQLTGDEMAQKFSKALGEPVRYNAVPFDVFRGLGFPGAQDLGNMFQFYAEFADTVNKSRDVEATRKLNPELQSFDDWLERNKDKITLE
jgi:uncharacterized protein YbjT (DUF2867 family)